MRLVIDMQGAQSTDSKNCEIAQYTLSLAKAIARNCGKHELILVLNSLFPETIEPIRADFDGLLRQENIRVWHALGPVNNLNAENNWRRQAAELIREAFIANLKPDIVLVSNLFEGLNDDAVTSIGTLSLNVPTTVILYELIQFIHRYPALEKSVVEIWYENKLGHLRRSDMLLAVSESSRQYGIRYLGFSEENSVNISISDDSQSMDNSAILTITALENFHIEHCRLMAIKPLPTHRPKLAYLSPLPPEHSGISDYSAELLPELSRHYDIDVIIAQDSVSDSWINANCHIRNVDWFRSHTNRYERVLYHFGNSYFHQYMFSLLKEIPGVVVLHDFFLSGIVACMDVPNSWVNELYHAHGYNAVQEYFHATTPNNDVHWKYPCNLSVLREAQGIIVHSENSRKLAKHWYNTDHADNWAVIPSSQECAVQYFEAIERFYTQAQTGTSALIQAVAALDNCKLNDSEYLLLAQSIAHNIPVQHFTKQILLDISAICRDDPKTGIQRVARSLLIQLINTPPDGYRIEPVYLSDIGGHWHYRYARAYTFNLLGCPTNIITDEPIDAQSGDIVIGLDLFVQGVIEAQSYLDQLYQDGVKIYFLVHDILPILMPEMFPPGTDVKHANWLYVITQYSGAICVSNTVAKDLQKWFENYCRYEYHLPYTIIWSHHGADLENSVPSIGLPNNAKRVLKVFQNQITFLMVGTIEPRKGHTQVLAAFEQLWSDNVEVNLVIVGKQGWMVEELIKKLHNHPKFGKHLFWLDGISDEYLEKIYIASTCLIAASEGEGFGLPLIEAAQHKLPIIARDIPVFREVAGEHAFYFNGTEPEQLVKTIKQWLELNQKKLAPSSEGLRWLTWEQSAKQLLLQILPKQV